MYNYIFINIIHIMKKVIQNKRYTASDIMGLSWIFIDESNVAKGKVTSPYL